MLMSPKIRELTFNAAPTEQIRRAAIGEGMRTLYWDGIDKVLRGVTTLEEVLRTAKRSECRNEIVGSHRSAANNPDEAPATAEQKRPTRLLYPRPGAYTSSGERAADGKLS